MKAKTLALLLVLMLVFSAVAQEKTGTAGAQFLKIGIGPRMMGMGGACVATGPADASIAFWNPAGLTRIPGGDVFFEDNEWVAETRLMSFAGAYNFGNIGVFGLTATYLDYGDMTRTTQDRQDGSLGTFTASDLAVGVAYARKFTDRFSVGLRGQYIMQSIDTYDAMGWSIDIGTLYDTGFKSLRIGMAIQHFGGDMRFDGTYGELQRDGSGYIITDFSEFSLPMTFRLGLAYDILEGEDHFITLGLDAIHPNDAEERVNLGLEYRMFNLVALRVGYELNYDFFAGTNDDSLVPGLTAGVGFKVGLGRTSDIHVDAAYADLGRLGYSLRFALGFSF
jgi:hypothetical protein